MIQLCYMFHESRHIFQLQMYNVFIMTDMVHIVEHTDLIIISTHDKTYINTTYISLDVFTTLNVKI